jgi:chitinase
MLTRHAVRISSTLACAAALVAACSSNSNVNGGSSDPTVTQQQAAPAAPDPAPTGTGGNGSPAPTPGAGGQGPSAPTPQTLSHHRCAWLNDNVALGTAALQANAGFFDAVHPYWWTLGPTGNVNTTSFTDDATITATARAHSIKLMPLVYGGDDANTIRNVLKSDSAIATHAAALVQLAVSHQYDGIELDYEHLWDAGDRAGYVALVSQLAKGLHAQNKELSLAVPAIAVDTGSSAYDYAALVAAGADVIHLMGYDFHYVGSSHLGPLAPLGWIDAVAARVQSLGLQESFVLGIANYGIGSGWYANSADAIGLCGSGYSSSTNHMATCSFGVYDAGLAPHCTTPKGDIWFEDAASAAEKAKTAKGHALRGVAYYTLGGEAPGLLDAIKAQYP